MDVTDACHIAYADQLEETIREWGPTTAPRLAMVMWETPLMEAARRMAGVAKPALVGPNHMAPYLALLRNSGRIRYRQGESWTAATPAIDVGMVDPTPAAEQEREQ